MEGYVFFLSDMVSMYVRGFYSATLLGLIIYFGFGKKERQKYHVGFACACCCLMLSLAFGTLFRVLKISELPYLHNLSSVFELTIVPVFCWFGYLLIFQPKTWRSGIRGLAFAEVPFVLGIFVYLSLVKGDDTQVIATSIVFVMVAYSLLLAVTAMVLGFRSLSRFERSLLNSYSTVDGRDLLWWRNALIILPCLLLLYSLMCVVLKDANDEHLRTLYLEISCVSMVFLAYYLNKQRSVDMDMMQDVVEETEEADESSELLDKRLVERFEKTDAFTKSDLNIRQVSRVVGTNIHYLSRHLNEVRGMNFSQYVNNLRIDMACRLIEQSNVPLGELAARTGFKSNSAFFRVFKLVTGFSPADYPKGDASKQTEAPAGAVSSQGPGGLPALNGRELQLCRMIVSGVPSGQIAERMGLNETSLRVSRSRLRAKLGLTRKDSLKKYLEMYLK